MNIKPIASPAAIQQAPASDGKSRAIAAFNRATQGQSQEHPVQNASNVSVEELTAIGQSSETIDNSTEEETTTLEATEDTAAEETPAKDPALSRQFAQLARQEKALRAKAQQQHEAYRAREAALNVREAALATQPKSTGISLDRIKQDALGVLAEAGVSYDELTQQIISRQPVDPQLQAHINKLEAKLAALEEQGTTNQKAQAEQQQQAYQAAVKQISRDAKALVEANPEEYEAISKTGTVKEIVNLIVKTHEKDGIVLSVEEAAQEVENYLIEENIKMANSIGKIKKRLAMNSASSKAAEEKTQATKMQTQPTMKTLTNATASSRKLSARERALLAFKGELKG